MRISKAAFAALCAAASLGFATTADAQNRGPDMQWNYFVSPSMSLQECISRAEQACSTLLGQCTNSGTGAFQVGVEDTFVADCAQLSGVTVGVVMTATENQANYDYIGSLVDRGMDIMFPQ